MGHRPTTLRLFSRHCAAAVQFYDDDAPYDRRIFTHGIAAHACIQAVTEVTAAAGERLDAEDVESVTLAVCERMIAEGRTFEGKPEPPLSADAVWKGRRYALRYLDETPPPLDAELVKAEIGLAVEEDEDGSWRPVPYSKDARLRLIADQVTVTEELDEESGARVLCHRDFKSAPSTDKDSLDTLQIRAQACLVWEHFGGEGFDVLRSEVVNLFTGGVFTRDLWMTDDQSGIDVLRRWREEISATMRALDRQRGEDGRYKANPGGACLSCPYLSQCSPGRAWASKEFVVFDPDDEEAWGEVLPGATARAWLVAGAWAKELLSRLVEICDAGPVDVDGRLVGFFEKKGRAPADDAWMRLAAEWVARGGASAASIAGFARAAGLGVTQVSNLAKALYPERTMKEEREAFVESLMKAKRTRSFGLHHPETTEETEKL